MIKRAQLLSVTLVALLPLLGGTVRGGEESTTAVPTAPEEKPLSVARQGDEAPPIDVTMVSGEDAPNWETLAGHVVILEFWASWCPPCIEAFPHLNELVETFQEEPVRFISVTYETKEMVKEFVEEHPLNTTLAIDNNFATFKAFNAWGLPTTILVNQEGVIAGVIHPKNLTQEVVQELLDGSVPQVEQAEAYPDPAGAEELFRMMLDREEEAW